MDDAGELRSNDDRNTATLSHDDDNQLEKNEELRERDHEIEGDDDRDMSTLSHDSIDKREKNEELREKDHEIEGGDNRDMSTVSHDSVDKSEKNEELREKDHEIDGGDDRDMSTVSHDSVDKLEKNEKLKENVHQIEGDYDREMSTVSHDSVDKSEKDEELKENVHQIEDDYDRAMSTMSHDNNGHDISELTILVSEAEYEDRRPTHDSQQSKKSKKKKNLDKAKRKPAKCDKVPKWKIAPPIDFRGFAGKDDMLSNFYPCNLRVYGMSFSSTEQAYQWRKAVVLENEQAAKEILAAKCAREAKHIANKHFWHVDLSKFHAQNIAVMRQLLRAKARCCEAFRNELRDTGMRYLAEVVRGESYWGIGDGTGNNVMGRLLMELQDNLDEALNADPDEDGKMVEFPVDQVSDPYRSRSQKSRNILLLGNSQVEGVRFENMFKNVYIKKLITSSIEEVHQFVDDEDMSDYSVIVLHLLSPDIVMTKNVVDLLEFLQNLVDKITAKMATGKIILSLAVYPSSSGDMKYCEKANIVTGEVFKRFKEHSNVLCKRNCLHLEHGDCFTKGGILSVEAEQKLAESLKNLIQSKLINRKQPKSKVDHQHEKPDRFKMEECFNYKFIFYVLMFCFVVLVCLLFVYFLK